MAAFGAIALASIYPTVVALRWRRASARDRSTVLADDVVRRLRRTVAAELAVVPVIPISAALMARGIGAM